MLYKAVDWITSKVIARVNPLEILVDKKSEACIKKYINDALGGKEGDSFVKRFKTAYETNRTRVIVLFYGLAQRELKNSKTITTDKFIDLLAKTYILIATQSNMLGVSTASEFQKKLQDQLSRIHKLVTSHIKREITEIKRTRYAIRLAKSVLKDIENLTPENREFLSKVLNVTIPADKVFEDLLKQYSLYKNQYKRLLSSLKKSQFLKADLHQLETLLKVIDKKTGEIIKGIDSLRNTSVPTKLVAIVEKIMNDLTEIHRATLKLSDYAGKNVVKKGTVDAETERNLLLDIVTSSVLKYNEIRTNLSNLLLATIIAFGLLTLKNAWEKKNPKATILNVMILRDVAKKLPSAIAERYDEILKKYEVVEKKIKQGQFQVRPIIGELIRKVTALATVESRKLRHTDPFINKLKAEVNKYNKLVEKIKQTKQKIKEEKSKHDVTKMQIHATEKMMEEKRVNLEQLAKRARTEVSRGFKVSYQKELLRTVYDAIRECLKNKKDTIDKLLKTVNNAMKWIERYYKYRKFVPVALVAASILVQVIMLKRLGYLKSYKEAINPKRLASALVNAIKHGSRKVKFAVAVLNLLLLAGVAMGGVLLLQKYSDKLTLDKIFEKASEINLSA